MKTLRELINLVESAQNPEQQYRIYFVIPEHDDYDDRHEPTETTIVTASSANEAGKKFRAEVPEAYIEQIVPLNYNKGMAEGEDDDVEHLANAFADIYYGGAGMGMVSATEKVKLARNIVQAVEDGRLSIEQLRQDLHDVDQLQKKLGRDGRFDEQDVAEDQATAKMGLMSAMGSNDNNPADQRRAMAQQAVERLATKR